MAKHEEVAEDLRRRIATGVYRPGERMPSDAELVREFGVSRPTIARAVGQLEQRGMVRRRRGSGTFVLETETADLMFGLLIPGLGSTEIFEPICAEIARLLQNGKRTLLWGGSSIGRKEDGAQRGEAARELCQQYVTRKVDGVFFSPCELVDDRDQINREIIEDFRRASIPVVLLDRDYAPFPERSELDLVGVDNHHIGRVVAQHLVEKGCRRPVFVAARGSAPTVDERESGFVETLRRLGVEGADGLIRRLDAADPGEVGSMVRELSPDGVACSNDAAAAKLMHSLEAIGVSVPRDVLVTGVDDVKYAELLRVPLTTVHQPCAAIGRAAYATMMERLDEPGLPARRVLMNTWLVERGSTRRP